MFLILLFILGLIIGSFLNCVIYRLEKNQSFISGRSFCPHCHHLLSWQDLIPVLSFIFLKGKCRYCQEKISRQYPLIELLSAVLFVFIASMMPVIGFNAPDIASLIYYLAICSLLILIFVFDLKHRLIPDQAIYFAIGITGLWRLFSGGQILNPLLSAVGASLFFLAIYFLTRKKGLGLGDVEIAFFMGLFLGFPKILPAIFLAFFSGALVGVALIVFDSEQNAQYIGHPARYKKTLKSELAFGPFLVAATIFSLFYGQFLIDLYLGFLIF